MMSVDWNFWIWVMQPRFTSRRDRKYQTVIINIQSAHYIMLNRPLIYTAVTRGKKKVILVGEKKALYMAVKRTETEKRGTNLAARIREYMN